MKHQFPLSYHENDRMAMGERFESYPKHCLNSRLGSEELELDHILPAHPLSSTINNNNLHSSAISSNSKMCSSSNSSKSTTTSSPPTNNNNDPHHQCLSDDPCLTVFSYGFISYPTEQEGVGGNGRLTCYIMYIWIKDQ